MRKACQLGIGFDIGNMVAQLGDKVPTLTTSTFAQFDHPSNTPSQLYKPDGPQFESLELLETLN